MRLFLCLIALAYLSAPAGAEPIAANRIQVIDGDTIRLDGEKPDYRLVGFNAPDKGSRSMCARENALAAPAARRLEELIAGGGVDIERVACSCRAGTEGMAKCNHGRFCAILRVGRVNVGWSLIKDGLAAPFTCGVTSCPKLPRPWCDPAP